jgi:hypothetical protein
MGGALPGQLGVIGLADKDQRAIGPFAYDHDHLSRLRLLSQRP